MTLNVAAITVDCDNALTLAEFWSLALGRAIDEGGPGASPFFARIPASPDSPGDPTMMFIKVPEGKSVKNRLHLDMTADDRDAEVSRLVALGATRVHDKDEWGIQWTTLADPEGNEFCIAEHHEPTET